VRRNYDILVSITFLGPNIHSTANKTGNNVVPITHGTDYLEYYFGALIRCECDYSKV
jgi:hypothetical protein